MREFIDKSSVETGTPINRDVMMALQGFDNTNTVFGPTSITQANGKGETLRVDFNPDGTITETFTGKKTITKKISFATDGSIMEEVLS